MTTQQPKSGSRPNRRPQIHRPPKKKKEAVPTLEGMLADFRKAYGMQLNTFVVQFVEGHSDEAINAFLPEDVSEADSWIEQHINAFTENEDPSTDDILDGVAALFMMAFLERLYEACGITNEDDYEDDGDDDGEDDGEEYEDDQD